MPELYAVIRYSNEKTVEECKEALRNLDIPFVMVSETNLALASKMTLAVARLTGADWVMAVDADVIITMPKEDIVEYCLNMQEANLLSFTGYLDDKTRGLITGLHFFDGRLTEKALDIVRDEVFRQPRPGTTHQREESSMLWHLRDNYGLNTIEGYNKVSFGLHKGGQC